MKILLINKFHYMKGGTETFHFNLAKALVERGHEVVFFSMQDERNFDCAQSKFFVDNIEYNDSSMAITTKIKLGIKVIYSLEAKRNIKRLIEEERPDIAHISLLHRQLSFSVVDELKAQNIPIVMHLHELSAICPAYTMLQPNGQICEQCLDGSFAHCVKNKCMKGSRSKSLLAFFEANFLRLGHYYDKIDMYIAECDFYRNLANKAGFTKAPIVRLNNFLPADYNYELSSSEGEYLLYFGRYSREKGVLSLLRAYSGTSKKIPLRMIGTGDELEAMQEIVREENLEKFVSIEGPCFGSGMQDIIKAAYAVVIPSEWYENGAYVVLESMAKGKIVITNRIAGLAEIIDDGKTGFFAAPFDGHSLSEAIENVLNLPREQRSLIERQALDAVKQRCDCDSYITLLESCYEKLIKGDVINVPKN